MMRIPFFSRASSGPTLLARSYAGLALSLLMAAPASSAAAQQAAPPGNVLSNFENHWAARIDRDCGYSRKVSSTESMWLFCDTAVYDWTGKFTSWIEGTTAARGPFQAGQVPTALKEVPTPPASFQDASQIGAPSRFLPNPSNLTAPDGSRCDYQAAWATGMATIPGTAKFLIPYQEVCVRGSIENAIFDIRGIGIIDYDPATNVLGTPRTLYRAPLNAKVPPQWEIGSPVFKDDYAYFFTAVCRRSNQYGVCELSDLYLAAVRATSWHDPTRYRWFAGGSAWTQDIRLAKTFLTGANAHAIHVDSYAGKGLVLIAQNDVGGGYTVWRSELGSPLGPWTSKRGSTPLTGCDQAVGVNLCRALIGHPEMSTNDHLLMSFFTPGAYENAPKGHVQMIAVPW